MRKICVLCETWASGGIESFLTNVLSNIDLTQLQVDIVAVTLKESIFTEHLVKKGVSFIPLSGNRKHVLKNKAMFENLLNSQKYDVVHVNAFHSGMLYYLRLARNAGVPVRIGHSHNSALQLQKWHCAKMLVHIICRHLFSGAATTLWACSRPAAGFLFSMKSMQRSGVHIVPNGIDLDKFRFNTTTRIEERKKLGITDQFLVGCVGRLCSQKNQVFLLRVFSELVQQNPNSRLLIVGDGPDRIMLERAACQLKIMDRTFFYGVTAHVERLLCAMDALAFPSQFEGLGIVAIEAQASGLPVVCSENIPQEAFISPFIHEVPLNAGETQWAKTLYDCSFPPQKRECGVDSAWRHVFNISNVSSQIESFYKQG